MSRRRLSEGNDVQLDAVSGYKMPCRRGVGEIAAAESGDCGGGASQGRGGSRQDPGHGHLPHGRLHARRPRPRGHLPLRSGPRGRRCRRERRTRRRLCFSG